MSLYLEHSHIPVGNSIYVSKITIQCSMARLLTVFGHFSDDDRTPEL